jgi:putative hemolysin
VKLSTLLIVSVIVVAWLTAAATAVRSVSRIWLRHWVEKQLSGAAAAELYLERPQRLLLAASTALAMAVFLTGAFLGTADGGGALVYARRLLAFALAFLIFGQAIPRAIARRWPTQVIPILLPPLRAIALVLMPVLRVLRRFAGDQRDNRDAALDPAHEAEELRELLREGEMEGVGERAEIAIISGVVEFGEKMLGDVVTPVAEIFALDQSLPPSEAAAGLAQSKYSRVPVYRGSLDNILGMVHVFDFLKAEPDEWPRLRPVAFALGNEPCNDFLFRMLRERKHLAVVRDDAGHTCGIVTLEDLLEELVGDIRDEHDEPGAVAPSSARGRV